MYFLKVLVLQFNNLYFRPVVVIVPDLQQICEIMLFSEGFLTAKILAKKMTVLYKLAKEQLSKQHHYDFGLRALKAVLVMAGDLKRGSPDLNEEVVLMRQDSSFFFLLCVKNFKLKDNTA